MTKTQKKHPLHDIVIQAFQERPAHDRVTLASVLMGVTRFIGKRAATGNRAYTIVAEDVLSYMDCQGHVKKDIDGWYRLP